MLRATATLARAVPCNCPLELRQLVRQDRCLCHPVHRQVVLLGLFVLQWELDRLAQQAAFQLLLARILLQQAVAVL